MKKTIIILILAILILGLAIFIKMEGQLKLPLDQQSKKIIERTVDEFLEDKIFDLIWKKTVHWITFFESLDGFHVTADAQSIDHNDVWIRTSAVDANSAYILKQPTLQGLITFSQKSHMRSAVSIDSVASVTAYIIVGKTGGDSYYGFKIVNNSLKGVSFDGTTEKTVDLQTISASTIYNIEARYSPADKIVFLVETVEKGVIIQNLPLRIAVVNINPMEIRITTNTTAAKTLQFSFFEYLQSRNILR